MFASHFVFLHQLWSRIGQARVPAAALLAGAIALAGTPHAIAAPACKPALAFKDVRFSEMHLETMQRKWTALLSVDFWADEAVEDYRLTGVSACPCRD